MGNARQSAYFYRNAFGFEVIAYAGLGNRSAARGVLRAAPGADHVRAGVAALGPIILTPSGWSGTATACSPSRWKSTTSPRRSSRPWRAGRSRRQPPHTIEDEHRCLRIRRDPRLRRHDARASSTDRGTRVSSPRASSRWMPDRYSPRTFHPVGLKAIDHIVANVEEGKMGDWVDYYSKIMGFSVLASFDDKDISTDYSALMSKVVADGRGRIKFPINEPAKSRRRSQIDEFLDFYGGPGVQHIAMATGDIIASVRAMVTNDVSFLKVPPAYYELLPDRVGTIKEDSHELAELGILVDRDDEGYLLQIFTKPVEDRPTLFFEIIQRRGRAASARGTSRPCSRPSSASRRGEERSSGWSNRSSRALQSRDRPRV